MAQRLNWEPVPTRHSFRVSVVIFLALKGMDRERLIEHLNWKFNTHMLARYLAWHLSQTPDSPAAILAAEFEKSEPFKCFEFVD